jgi:DNA processing protein
MRGSIELPNGAADAWVWLAHVAEPADRRVGALVRSLGPVEALDRIAAGRSGLQEESGIRARLATFDLARARESADRIGAHVIHRGSPQWPTQLDDLADCAPFALWVLGAASLRLTALRSIAIVGARAATPYGESVARDWAAHLADAGATIVSGGAFGIDAAAHRGAMEADGMTICVVAGGVDVAYPRAHEALLARIADEGLIVSESPLGEGVRRRRFLSRNRIIAALTRATVVVEAALRSGTTATANAAAALNRPVLAVPGPVTSPTSAGCHHLIREAGVILASCPDDVLDVVSPVGSTSAREAPDLSRAVDSLTERQARILDAVPTRGAIGMDRLIELAGLPAGDVAESVGMLAARGFIRADADGWRLVGRA